MGCGRHMFLQFQNNRHTEKDESQVWQSLTNGKREALDTLFRSYYGRLLNYGIKLVPNRVLVKDAIQKLFLKLWDKRQSLSKPKSVRSYLFVSMRRILLSKVKRQKAREERNLAYTESEFRESFNIEEVIIAGETRTQQEQVLANAIQKLSPRQKEALYLRFYDGLKNEEIADVMDIAHQSVRNHISEAIQKIKVHLPSSFTFPEIQPVKSYKHAESM